MSERIDLRLSATDARKLRRIANLRTTNGSKPDALRILIAEEHDRTSRVSDVKAPPENETDDAPVRAP